MGLAKREPKRFKKKEFKFYAIVEKVTDADTIKVRPLDVGLGFAKTSDIIRVIGYDAPEKDRRRVMMGKRASATEVKCGKLTKKYAQGLMHVGDEIIVISKKLVKSGRGKYGRILGEIIFLDDSDTEVNYGDLMYDLKYIKKYEQKGWRKEQFDHIIKELG